MDQITVVLTVNELNRVLDMLADRPFREVADVIYKMRSQGDQQIAAKESAAKAPNISTDSQ